MIDTKELRKVIADCYWPTSPVAISEILDRLEAAEKKVEILNILLDAKRKDYAAVQEENSEMRAKIERMEQQKPVGTAHAMPGAGAFTMACFHVQDIPVGAKLYALPGAEPVVTPKMEQAFYEKVEVTTIGSIRGLADGIKAAMLAAATETKPSVPDQKDKP